MIAVVTSTSTRFSRKSSITVSSAARAHLPVGDAESRLGDDLAQVPRHAVDRLDAVVHEEHLSAARELAQRRLADQPIRRGG